LAPCCSPGPSAAPTLTHWRVGDPFVVHIVLGMVVWLGIYLREPRLKALLPLRTR
jgi:hypothetical protein